jgi:hypothetical protein
MIIIGTPSEGMEEVDPVIEEEEVNSVIEEKCTGVMVDKDEDEGHEEEEDCIEVVKMVCRVGIIIIIIRIITHTHEKIQEENIVCQYKMITKIDNGNRM